MPREAKRQKLEDESIDSDEVSGGSDVSDAESEEKVIMSAEDKKLLMAQEYLEKMGVKYDGSSDLKQVAQALGIEGGDSEVKTISIADEIEFISENLLLAKNHRATCVEISFDDKTAYTGGKDGRIVIWDLAELKRVGSMAPPEEEEKSPITSIFLGMGGKVLVSASVDQNIRIWNLETRALLFTIPPTSHARSSCLNAISVIGDYVFSVSEDKTLRQYSLTSRKCIKACHGHGARLTAVDCLSQDHVLTVGDDKTARLWNLKFDKHSQYNAPADLDSCCVLNKHGFVTGDNKGRISLWSIARRKAVQTSSTLSDADPIASCSALACVPNTDAVFSGNENGLIQCWKASMADKGILEKRIVKDGEELSVKTEGIVTALKVSRSGRYLVAATSCESRLGRWNTRKTKNVGLLVVELRHSRVSKLFNHGDLIK